MEATAAGVQLPFENAREAWPLYDTMQIGYGVSSPDGVASYAALGQLEEIPFFTVRNRSEVGLAYTNKESKDSTPFVYYLHSIGVEFRSSGNYNEASEVPTVIEIGAMNSNRVFEQIMPYHVGMILRVREDEKLASTVEFAPPGMGLNGWTAGAVPNLYQSANQGWPSMGNRFQFPDPIAIPRSTVVSVSLKLSKYAKTLCAHMLGPQAGEITLVDDPDNPQAGYGVPANALIRVTLNGFRDVQQRGALHY